MNTQKSNITPTTFFLIFTVFVLIGCSQESIAPKTEIQEKVSSASEEFEVFLKSYGEEITLEAVDTTEWQIYSDAERGFSFEYPADWYVIPIAFERFPEGDQRAEVQEMYKKEQGWDIKSQTEPDPFLCVMDENNYKRTSEKLRELMVSTLGNYDEYCNIIFNEYRVKWNGEKRTSGELWLEHYSRIGSDIKFLKYIVNGSGRYVYSGNTLLRQFNFITRHNLVISLSANNPLKRELSNEVYPVFDGILESLSYTD